MNHETPNPPDKPNDKLFKAVFKRPGLARELLSAQAPEALLAILDLDTLSVTDSSFVDEQLSEDFADVVLTCRTKGNAEVLIPFILEHKSYKPPYPPFQIMHYQDRVWSGQIREKGQSPTPIVPVLFYHGEEAWQVRPWSSYLNGWEEVFQLFTPPGGYIFIDLSEVPDDEIKRFRSGFLRGALMLMKHRLEREFLLENIRVIINFVESDQS